jgi:hypothetical protein
MKATMILADYAQVADRKLYISGGGWTWTSSVCTFGIGLLVEVPWDRLNEKHQFRLALSDADGQPVTVTKNDVEEPIAVEGEFVGGRHPSHRPGTPLTIPAAMNFHNVKLRPGERYQWQLSINGESDEDWTLAFSTRADTPQAQAQAG